MVNQIMSTLNLFLPSLALLIISFSSIPNFASASLEEANALLRWKASLQFPNNSFISSWTLLPVNATASTPCTSWFGVVCNHDWSIHSLNLTSSQLNGTLHQFPFSFLHNLSRFELSLNHFFGPIPAKIGLLSKLVSLDLSGNNFSGVIPPEIGMLASLETLHLFENNLNGSIPQEIGQLTFLYELALYDNFLEGELPPTLGNLRNLASLILDNNRFSCQIPNEFGNLVNLVEMYISSNSLNGHIPPTIGKLKKLTTLYLFQNDLTGSIPQELGSLVSLEALSLFANNLSGPIPSSLGSLTALNLLHLYQNQLSGSIPAEIGNLKSLTELALSENQLSGPIPLSLKNLSKLQYLYLNTNNLSGPIPQGLESPYMLDVLDNGTSLQTFQRLTNLTELDLSYNNFRGDWELDALLSSLPNLHTLILSHSGISVTTSNASNHYVNPAFSRLSLASCSLKVFPVFIRAMANLEHLDLSNNEIQGHIPDWIGEIGRNQLSVLNLKNNSLTGTIPNVYKNWSTLEGFILNGNQLEGKVPTSLNKCQRLKVIDMGNNQLSDTFPGWLGGLPNLQDLVLKSNNFYGGIETTSSKYNVLFQSLRVLDLSHNGFVGQLPTKYFQNFNAMKNVVKHNTKPEYVSLGHQFNYSLTIMMKGVDQYFPRLLVDYTIVDLSDNKFDGEIPNIIGYMKSLKVLNLSHNSLIGRIPHAFGNISEIESLDLSWNQLTGEIPQSLADLTFLEFLNLSQNHLVGRIPQGRQFNTFDEYSFGGNLNLCGLPLPKKCSEHSQKPLPEGDGDGEEENAFTWKVVVMGYGCGTLLGIVLGYLMLSTGKLKWFNAIVDEIENLILKRQNKRK